jgi:hypothetical protein|tara:strand:- start:287 stop:532 length:246 start_codon:yes stop_codon:yes gene_type:complete
MNHQAIYNTHPNVVSIDDGEGAKDANGNPVAIDQSLVDAEAARLQEAQEAEAAQKAADKASANQKLRDLGLTDAEIEALKS